jgi:hypothetical protein
MSQAVDPGLIGQKIVAIRPLTPKEVEAFGWDFVSPHNHPVGIVLEDGSVITAQADEEWNGPGAIAQLTKDGLTLGFA